MSKNHLVADEFVYSHHLPTENKEKLRVKHSGSYLVNCMVVSDPDQQSHPGILNAGDKLLPVLKSYCHRVHFP